MTLAKLAPASGMTAAKNIGLLLASPPQKKKKKKNPSKTGTGVRNDGSQKYRTSACFPSTKKKKKKKFNSHLHTLGTLPTPRSADELGHIHQRTTTTTTLTLRESVL
jgi:hypothetical protein